MKSAGGPGESRYGHGLNRYGHGESRREHGENRYGLGNHALGDCCPGRPAYPDDRCGGI